ncbi:hypothetical protein Tsp_05846 [Trichinella spiralis]|nr:hypothetical protein Tsp_05846 [Trichinella spiralis]
MAFMIFLAYGIGLAGRICESQALRDFETLFRASRYIMQIKIVVRKIT